MTEMFGEAWSPMSVPDLAPDDDDDLVYHVLKYAQTKVYQNRMIGTCLNLRLKFEKKIAKINMCARYTISRSRLD